MAGRPPRAPLPEPSMTPHEGLHCSHYFYQLDHAILRQLDRSAAADSFQAALNPQEKDNTQRLQTYTISGHRADFCVMLMDGDPLKIDAVHQSLMASEIGPAIRPTWSFVSMSEVSEYVPTVEQFREGLIKKEGMEEGSEEL
ncbi:MAG: chlorite dismutase family protein, partial [Planctomycetota bacterium]